jgi:hypothetical protein
VSHLPGQDQLPEAERRKLESQLLAQLRSDCQEMRSLGYRPRDFLAMIGESGPIRACIQVITSQRIPDGFLRLLEIDRLQLSAEATVLKMPWRRLFEEPVLDAARKRLIAYRRPDLAAPPD